MVYVLAAIPEANRWKRFRLEEHLMLGLSDLFMARLGRKRDGGQSAGDLGLGAPGS